MAVTQPETVVPEGTDESDAQSTDSKFHTLVARLSEQSVRKNFDA